MMMMVVVVVVVTVTGVEEGRVGCYGIRGTWLHL